MGAGHVGLSAATAVLQALGHRVLGLPTVMLSNHPGWPHVAGGAVPPDEGRAMLQAWAENGWLNAADAVLTGYLPTPAHADLAAEAIGAIRARAPGARVVVDPVLGDAPGGLYVPEAAARAVRERVVPLADVLTPNLFELGWLTGADCASLAAARRAGEGLAPELLVTSVVPGADRVGVLGLGAGGPRLWSTPRRDGVPHGVGDAFAALIAAGHPPGAALGCLDALIRASLGAGHLRIAEAARDWTGAAPLAPEPLPDED